MRAHLTSLVVALATWSPVAAAAAAGGAAWLGDFRVTYYWVAREDSRFDGEPRTELLLDASGAVLARVSPAFRVELDREGAGRLADGRVLAVATKRDGRWRYLDLGPGANGLSALGTPLEPFVSVAVDPLAVPRGARLRIPAYECLPLPGGEEHRGIFVADDTGSAIRGARIDVFIGDVAHLARFESAVPSHASTPVFLETEEGER